MERKLNSFIKKVEIYNNCLDKLNTLIEEKCINSGVLLVIDFITYKTYFKKLEEIKKCSLNHIEIFVLSNLNIENYNKIKKLINETYDLIVGIGEFSTLKFAENFAIKNNISYAFVNLFNLKSELFCKNFVENDDKILYFSPFFVLIEKNELKENQIFEMHCNIFKYSYLILEYNLNLKKEENLEGFLKNYNLILNDLNNDNVLEKAIALGLLLNKYKINFISHNKLKNEFNEFIIVHLLNIIYNKIFVNVNKYNLYFSRQYKNNKVSLYNFSNFDFDFNKYYLLSIKEKIINLTNNFNYLYKNFYEKLKQISIKKCYELSKTININLLFKNILIASNEDLFLKKMGNFELFNLKKVINY